MPQIAFLTLFLGLTSGMQPIALSVVGDVAAVELMLDGRAVARLTAPPWRGEVDFGAGLLPHTLAARALDAGGAELAQVAQLVNLPRAAAEAELQLERDATGTARSARILWQSLTGAAPLALSVRLDGKTLPVGAAGRVELPPSDPTLPHVLSAELRFASGVVARRDAAFGGELGSELRTEITAAALRLPGRPKSTTVGAVETMLARGQPVRIAAHESAPARIVVVRDPATVAPMLRLRGRGGVAYSGPRRLTPTVPTGAGSAEVALPEGASLRFLWPQAAASDGHGVALKLFDASREFSPADGSLLWMLTHVLEPLGRTAQPRYADAVAVAGVLALAGNARRAVVLVLGDESPDPSHYDAATVIAYLRAVRVPLFVWRLDRRKRGTPASPWGEGRFVGSAVSFAAAAELLDRELAAQRIVWIDGAFGPHELALPAEARAAGVRFAGEEE